MKKAKIWLAIWGGALVLGAIISRICWIAYFFKTGTYPSETLPYEPYEKFLLFLYLPMILMPTISLSLYFSIKGKIKYLSIITSIILLHHIICVVGAIIGSAGI